ncbi:hypothetical protein [Variovorax sp. E3]|uniref:hypothetical protein n=1 Tax=Variovorax sp. E3 TaxID=1914993 RepID=UPI0022B6E334|nr:hypothetical protein [Variovorax sp. E3]
MAQAQTWLEPVSSASSSVRSSAFTGMASTGTLSTLLPTMKRDQMRHALACCGRSGLAML